MKKIRRHFEEVLKIKTSPHEIALGFAIGTFIAIFPTFGFGIVIGLILILLFKKISKISLILAFAFWNPITLIPVYALGYKIGDLIFSDLPIKTFNLYFLDQVFVLTRRLLLGNIILAFIFSIISYFIVFYIVRLYQRRNLNK